MKRNRKIYFFLIVVVLFIAIFVCQLCSIDFDNKKVEKIFNSYKDNEKETIEISTDLLNEKFFSKTGVYSLYLSDDDKLKLDILNYLGEYETYVVGEQGEIATLSYYQDYSVFIKEKNIERIEISVYLYEGKTYRKSVTFKHSFFYDLAKLWIYYGDYETFPSCPYDYSRRDNIKNMTDKLYYAYYAL